MLKQFALDVPQGWKSELFMDKMPKQLAPGDGCALTFRVTPPIDAQPTKAYFHRDDPETDAIYKIDDPKYLTLALATAAGRRRTWSTASMASTARFTTSLARRCTTPRARRGPCRWRSCRRSSVEASPATQIILAGSESVRCN